MPHTPEEKRHALSRIRRIKGQIGALERGLEDGMACQSALQQLAAVRGAVNGLMAEVLEMYLREEMSLAQAGARDVSSCIEDSVALVRSYLK